MKKIGLYIAFLFLRLTESIMAALPRKLALFLGYSAGLALFYSGLRKNVIKKNMLHVNFCPPAELNSLIKKVYCTTSQYAVDFLRNEKNPVYRVHNFEVIDKLLAANKGVIAILGHFGNWELLATIFGSKVKSLHVVAQTLNNPYTHDWVEKKRTATRVETIYRENALRKMLGALSKNSIIAILIDQYSGKHGVDIPFLDKPASTVKTVAGLIHKTKCPAVSAYALLREDKSYDIYIEEVTSPVTAGMSDEDAIKAHQTLHNEIISSWIRKYPEHYFGWFHKRYKDHLRYAVKS